MGQVKKAEIHAAIQGTALRLFSRKGYARTSLEEIARGAGVSTANVYIYFASKLEILYSIYEPWMGERLDRLEAGLAREPNARRKLNSWRLAVALAINKFAMLAQAINSTSATTARIVINGCR